MSENYLFNYEVEVTAPILADGLSIRFDGNSAPPEKMAAIAKAVDKAFADHGAPPLDGESIFEWVDRLKKQAGGDTYTDENGDEVLPVKHSFSSAGYDYELTMQGEEVLHMINLGPTDKRTRR